MFVDDVVLKFVAVENDSEAHTADLVGAAEVADAGVVGSTPPCHLAVSKSSMAVATASS